MKKYELTQETIDRDEVTLYRIKAVKDFANVRAGDLGGYVEGEINLSQEGNAWVYGDALVYGNALVYGDAWVCGNAEVCGDSKVYGEAWVCGDSKVYGEAEVCGDVVLKSNKDFTVFYNYGDANRSVTVFKSNKIVCGCFVGDLEDFKKAVNEKYKGEGDYQLFKMIEIYLKY